MPSKARARPETAVNPMAKKRKVYLGDSSDDELPDTSKHFTAMAIDPKESKPQGEAMA